MTRDDWITLVMLGLLFLVAFGPIIYREWKRPPNEFDSHF